MATKSTTQETSSKVPPTAKLHQESITKQSTNNTKKEENNSTDEQTGSLSEASKFAINSIFWFYLLLDVLSHLGLIITLLGVIDYNEHDVRIVVLALIAFNVLLIIAILPTNINTALHILNVKKSIRTLFLVIRIVAFILATIAITFAQLNAVFSLWFLFQSLYLATTFGLVHQEQRTGHQQQQERKGKSKINLGMKV